MHFSSFIFALYVSCYLATTPRSWYTSDTYLYSDGYLYR